MQLYTMMQAMSKQLKMVLKTILKVQLIYFFQCNFKKPSHCNGFLLGTWSSLLSSIRNSRVMKTLLPPLLFIEFFHLKSKLWAAEKKVQSMSFLLLLWEFCRIKNFFSLLFSCVQTKLFQADGSWRILPHAKFSNDLKFPLPRFYVCRWKEDTWWSLT